MRSDSLEIGVGDTPTGWMLDYGEEGMFIMPAVKSAVTCFDLLEIYACYSSPPKLVPALEAIEDYQGG